MHRVIRRLLAHLQQLGHAVGMPGRAQHDALQLAARQMMRAGGTDQDAVAVEQPQSQLIDAVIGLLALLEVFFALDEGRRVDHHHIELLAIVAQRLERLEGIAFHGADFDPVQRGILAGQVQGRFRTVHANHLAGAAGRGQHTPAAQIAEYVQHPLTLDIAAQPGAVVALIKEPAGLLPRMQRRQIAQAVLFQLHAFRYVAVGDLDILVQTLQLAHRQVVAQQNAGRLQNLHQRAHNGLALRLHAGGGALHHQLVAKAVHDQARQAIGLAVHQPIKRLGKQALAQTQRHLNAVHQQRLVEGDLGIAAHQAGRDQGMRIHIAHAQHLAGMRLDPHRLARREIGQRRGLRVHLVAEHPQVPGLEAAIFVLLESDSGGGHGVFAVLASAYHRIVTTRLAAKGFMPENTRNRLGAETSPYLLQHADNPVDWYPWGEEALERARRENKPILLSIGYAACHWCHVMAHESFESPVIADLMNRHFVNIKVDREERPDIDRTYQLAQQLLNRRAGGWPLTVFLDPDTLTPFFAGTYFPARAGLGMPGFGEVCERVATAFEDQQEAIKDQGQAITEALRQLQTPRDGDSILDGDLLASGRDRLMQHFDAEHGGFGGAPKFPQTSSLAWLWQHALASADLDARNAVQFSLRKMTQGGVYDHLAGGFFRYTVDGEWQIPHFEKMLYDQGPLLGLCSQVAATSGDAELRDVVLRSATWLQERMQGDTGGMVSSLDADTNGEEGGTYVWDRSQLELLLEPEDYRAFSARFGLDEEPNFEGRWHLHVANDWPAVANAMSEDQATVKQRIERSRDTLLTARRRRAQPGRDEKYLAGWNGLLLGGLARAANRLDAPDLQVQAERIAEFLKTEMWRDGRLLASLAQERPGHTGFLDDYAFIADGLLALLECRWRGADLEWATALADIILEHFQDIRNGGFWLTPDDAEVVVQRPRVLADESMPSGYGVATRVLIRLGHLLGNEDYLEAAEEALLAAAPALKEMPEAHATLLAALEDWLHPERQIIVRAPETAISSWRAAALGNQARQFTLLIPDDADDLPGLLAEREARHGGVAYVCQGMHCDAPLESPDELRATLAD